MKFICSFAILHLLLACHVIAAEWPQWRGPDGQGHATATNLPQTWSESSNVVWRTPIDGKGWSSPVVEGDMIWLTTSFETAASAEERERQLIGNTNNQPLNVVSELTLRAVGIDRRTGKVKHDVELLTAKFPEPIHTMNTFASPTPVVDGGRLYCHFGSNGTACLDTRTGKVLWTNRELQIKHENGPGSSPVLWRNRLIVHCDGSDAQYIAALDTDTGRIAWKTNRSGEMDRNPQLKKAYGTPIVIEQEGKPLVISPGANWLYAYDPASGKELWKVGYGILGFSIVPRPVYGHGLVFFSTSFLQAQLIAVRLDGSEPKIEWRFQRQAPQMPSPLLVGDELYLISDKGIATCLNARTGEVHWAERLGGNFSSSPMFADGRIYISNREGATYVLAPGTTFQLLAKNELDGAIFATPAALDQTIYVRTEQALYCLKDLSKKSETNATTGE